MALTTTWYLQGVTPTVISDTDIIAFSDGTFGNTVTVGAYNGGTHVKTALGVDKSSANTPNNVKYVASGTGDWGDGTESLSLMTTAEASLKITVAYDTNITVTDITMFGFDGTTPATAPVGMDIYLAEQGDSTWTNADGSASALDIDDSDTPATSHNFYVAISCSPSSVGEKTANDIRFSFNYQ